MTGRAVVGVVLLLAVGAAPATAQRGADHIGDASDVGRTLREAAAWEVRGEFARAAALLEGVLEERPATAGALFALERVLRQQGRLETLLPRADRYLALEPTGSGVRYLKLRVLVEVDSLEAVEPAVRAWIEAEPDAPEPWREGARIVAETEGADAALALVREGEAALGDAAPLALEAGDLLHADGRTREAVQAWSRGVGEDGGRTDLVLRRLRELDDDVEGVVEPMIEALTEGRTTPERRRAAVLVAVQAGLGPRAVELAADLEPDLDEAQGRSLLAELARRGDEEGHPVLAQWAWERLRASTADVEERRALDERIASAALAAGDTAAAVAATERRAEALPVDAAERRRALATALRLRASRPSVDPDPRGWVESLSDFRAAYPEAPELDELTALVARALRSRGETAMAAGVLENADGPRSALAGGYLLLERGELEPAAAALDRAAADLPASQATEVLQLTSLLGRLDPAAAALVGRSAALARGGDPDGGLDALEAGLGAVPAADRPAVLAHGARVADRHGRAERAAALRAELLERHADAPEAAEATVDLARWRGGEGGDPSGAVALLESLILERPNHPLVPAARRELQRLRQRVPPGPTGGEGRR